MACQIHLGLFYSYLKHISVCKQKTGVILYLKVRKLHWLYAYIYIFCIVISSKFKKIFFLLLSNHHHVQAISMDIPDPLSPPLSIIHCFRQVLRDTSCIGTELLYVGSSWNYMVSSHYFYLIHMRNLTPSPEDTTVSIFKAAPTAWSEKWIRI